MISQSEVDVLEVSEPALGGPVFVHRGVTMATPHIQLKDAVLVGSLVADVEGRDGDLEGQQT